LLRTSPGLTSNREGRHRVVAEDPASNGILDHLDLAVVLVDRDARAAPGASRACADLLGATPRPGQDLGELLRPLDARRYEDLAAAVEQICDDLLPEDVALAQLPAEWELPDGRSLGARGQVVREASGAITGVLLVFEDVTAAARARRQARLDRLLLKVLHHRVAFRHFVADVRAMVAGASRPEVDLVTRRRAVHTIKGAAAAWGIDAITGRAHRIESEADFSAPRLRELEAELDALLSAHADLLGFDGVGVDGGPSAGSTADTSMARAADLLGPVRSFVAGIAERLGKRVSFSITGEDVAVDVEAMGPVLRAVPHLLGNAIDHGIEHPADRGVKPMTGRLDLRVIRGSSGWRVEVEDDGRGLALDRLIARAEALGIVGPATLDGLSTAECLEVVLVDGVTDAPSATEVSGRGVGMSAVRAAVSEVGGGLSLITSEGEGTLVVATIPDRQRHGWRLDPGQLPMGPGR